MPTDLAALIGSRICHDLISPIGAIGNGGELLSLSDNNNSAEISLISESVDNANARIRFFRIAFGAAGTGQSIGKNEIRSILDAMAQGGRFTYDWQIEGDQPRPTVRCAFLMLLCLEVALPLGGNIEIELEGETWALNASGRRVKVDEPLWQSLSKPDDGFAHTAANVQFALLPDIIAEAGRALRIDLQQDRIVARF